MLRRLFLALLLVMSANPASAEVRALVLTANYATAADAGMQLPNPIVDGRRIAGALQKAGVSDVRLVEEPTAPRWQSEFLAFTQRLAPSDIALIYYAGHGFQISGQNYLVAADGETLIALEEVMKRVTARARGTVLIIDACRDNPLTPKPEPLPVVIGNAASRTMQTVQIDEVASRSRGLAQLGDLRGLSTIVLFSTEPGNIAFDGQPGRGSPFAIYAAKELSRRQSLDSAFRRIAVAVNKATDGQQSPWRQGDLPFDVYIAGMTDFPTP